MDKKNKSNKKKFQLNISKKNIGIICAVGVILLLFVAVPSAFVKKDNGNLNKTIQYSLEKTRMIPVSKDGLVGFLNYKGKELTKIDYTYVTDYSGKYAVVKKDEKYYLLNEKGKVVKEAEEPIQYDEVNDNYIIDGKLYNNKLKLISKKSDIIYDVGFGYYRFETEDGKTTGVMNSKAKKIYSEKKNTDGRIMVYINEVNENNKNVYCAVSPDNVVFTIINCDTGKEIVKYSNNTILANGNNIFQIQTKDGYKNVFIDNDKIVLETKGAPRMVYVSKGYIVYKESEDGDYKYFDVKKGKSYNEEPFGFDQATKTDFEEATNISRINSNGKYGLIKDDRVIVPCEYDKIYFFANDLFNYLAKQGKHYVIARDNKYTYLYDLKTKKRVKKFNTTDNISYLADSTFIYYVKSNKIYVYNLVTEKENTYEADGIDIYGNYIKIYKGDQVTYFDRSLNKIFSATSVEKKNETTNDTNE